MSIAKAQDGPVDARRDRTVVRHAGFGLACRVGAIGASFLAVPLLLRMLGTDRAGAWLVLLSAFQWVTFFDLGAAAGARNQLARTLAAGDEPSAQRTLTTGWFYTAAISLALFGIAAVVMTLAPIGRWSTQHVFNGQDVGAALWIVAGAACLSLALGYIQSVYAAFEKASAFSLFSLLTTALFLAFLLIASATGAKPTLTQVSLLYGTAIVAANLLLIAGFFRQNPTYRPQRSQLDHTLRQPILSFGVRLFLIQLAALVLFTTDRLMASAWLGPSSVVVYDAGMKVFALVTMLHTLVMATLWSSFTRAHEQGDWHWIERMLLRMTWLMVPLGAGCVTLVFATPWLVGLWLGPAQVGPSVLYVALGAVTFLSCWSNIFAYFLNAVGETRVQLISACIAAALFAPVSHALVRFTGLGLSGIAVGLAVSLGIFSLAGPIETVRILRKRRVQP